LVLFIFSGYIFLFGYFPMQYFHFQLVQFLFLYIYLKCYFRCDCIECNFNEPTTYIGLVYLHIFLLLITTMMTSFGTMRARKTSDVWRMWITWHRQGIGIINTDWNPNTSIHKLNLRKSYLRKETLAHVPLRISLYLFFGFVYL